MNKESKINEIVEHIIKKTKISFFHEHNKTIDFSVGDIVKCSYLPGLFRVLDNNTELEEVIIYPVDLKGELETVRVQFIEKVDVKLKTLEVLFHD